MIESAVRHSRSFAERLGAPTDLAWLAAFRIFFGCAMAVSMARFLAYGWVEDFFVKPSFHFKYWGFAWVEPLSRTGMIALFWAMFACSVAMTLGLFHRIASALFVVGFVYIQLIDVTTYLNHYYLAALLGGLLILAPANRMWSVDAWLANRRATLPRAESAPAVWLWLFRFQVGVVYTFAGIAKAHADWLVHGQPLRIWLGSRSGMPLLGVLFRQSWAAPAMSWAGFLFDTTIAWFLLVRRARPYAFAVVVVFHSITSALFPIGMFPVLMVLSALVFFEPSWPRAIVAKVAPGRLQRPPPDAVKSARIPRWGFALLAAYAAFQLIFPLRFLAYGGDVRWHEQGMRFSWRVMVREKNGSVTYLVRNKLSGRTWHVQPRAFLNPQQEREMSGQPDLILQLAHRIRRDFEARGLGPVEVRVDALVSLNGRPIAPLIDPTIDLTAIEDGVERARWILPVPSTLPPHLRPI